MASKDNVSKNRTIGTDLEMKWILDESKDNINYNYLQYMNNNCPCTAFIRKDAGNTKVWSEISLGRVSGDVICELTPGTVFKITKIQRQLKMVGNSSSFDDNEVGWTAHVTIYPDEAKEIVTQTLHGYIRLFNEDFKANHPIYNLQQQVNKATMNIGVGWKNMSDIPKGYKGISGVTDPTWYLDDGFHLLDSGGGTLDTACISQSTKATLKTHNDELAEKLASIKTPLIEPYYPEAKSSRWVMDDSCHIISAQMEDYKAALESIDISKLRGIFGLPYQFLPTTDCRIDNSETDSVFGITYSEMIASRFPLLYITPGEPVFLSDINNGEDRKKYIGEYIQGLASSNTDYLNDLLEGYAGKLYSIEPKYSMYYKYVNPMCRMGAFYLGLDPDSEDESDDVNYKKIDGIDIVNYNWAWNDNGNYEGSYNEGSGNAKFSDISGAMNDLSKSVYYRQCIPFYINSDSSFQETMTNETTESSLASNINGLSDKARELQFLIGSTTSAVAQNFDAAADVLASSKEAIDSMLSKLTESNIFSNLFKNIKTVVSGGRLMFPQIWSNSGFSKSYQINMKLTTPDFDKKSWYLNIYVPLCHLIALVLPRGEFQNGYTAPFIIKAFYKGMFNIDMGIITDMTINKGKEGGWTKDGLPTVVDVSFTIQDLYSTLSMTPTGTLMKKNVMQNIAEMDYLANLCGVNINEPDVGRMIEMYVTFNIENVFTDVPTNLLTGLSNKFSTKISTLLSIF